jgi:hypothetical protein
MKSKYMIPVASLLVGSACVVATPNPVPIPQAVHVRVTHRVGYRPHVVCAGAWRERRAEGTLITLDADTLVLYVSPRGPEVAISVAQITKLEVYRGHKGSAEAAAKGAVIGAGLGAVLGATTAAVGAAVVGGMLGVDPDVGEAAAEGAAFGTVEGAVTGAVYGATMGMAVWQEVTVERLRQEFCHCRVPGGGLNAPAEPSRCGL